ncbi:MAG: 30S ribosomal protein S16 [Anaerolineales bacterium]
MVRIRLRRAGGKGQPTHRIVAADKESPRDGRFIEILGDYNPRTEPATIRIKEDRVYHWLSVGAQPSNAVLQVFRVVGLMERYQRYKDGEDLEALVAEGKQVEADRKVDPRTRRDDLVKKSPPKKKEEPVVEAAIETEVEEAEEPAALESEAEAVEAEAEAPEVETVPDTEAEEVSEEEPQAEVEEAVEEEAPVEEVSEEESQAEVEEAVEEEAPVEEVAEEEPQAEVEEAVEVKITNAARKLAEDAGIDLSTVKGTGKDGGILKSDITKLIKD